MKYSKMVSDLAKPGQDIVDSTTGGEWELLSRVATKAIIAGAVLDDVKKQVVYRKGFSDIPMPPGHVPTRLTSNKAHLIHMAAGIAGEACELLELIHAHVYTDAPLGDEVIKELGDIEFYLEGVRQGLGTDRNEVIDGNMAKLSARYAEGTYSDAAAVERADVPSTVWERLRAARVVALDKYGEGSLLTVTVSQAAYNLLMSDPEAKPYWVWNPVADVMTLGGMSVKVDHEAEQEIVING